MVSVGTLFGVFLGEALFGTLFAWILRRIVPLGFLPSYAIGVGVAAVLFGLFGGRLAPEFDSPFAVVAAAFLCGVIAFGLLTLTSRRARRGA